MDKNNNTFNGNYLFNFVLLLMFDEYCYRNETLGYSVKKVAINPQQQERNRSIKRGETVKILQKSRAELVTVLRGQKADKA